MITVTSPANSHRLISLAEAKDWLGETGEDAAIANLLDEISAQIENYCNRIFVVETVSEYLFEDHSGAPGINELQLERWPVISVTSVLEGSDTRTETTDFIVNKPEGVLVRVDYDWTYEAKTIVYSTGYATIPDNLKLATKKLLASAWASKGRDSALKAQEIPGVIKQEWWVGGFQGGLPAEVALLLNSYRSFL